MGRMSVVNMPASLRHVLLAVSSTTAPAKFISHRRGQRRLHPKEALVRIENVLTTEQAQKYVGLECMLGKVYDSRTPLTKQGKRERRKPFERDNMAEETPFKFETGTFEPQNSSLKFKTVLGKIVKTHGNRGCVVVRFERNLAPVEVNSRVYIKLNKAIEYEE